MGSGEGGVDQPLPLVPLGLWGVLTRGEIFLGLAIKWSIFYTYEMYLLCPKVSNLVKES